jgi:hypothetical protein
MWYVYVILSIWIENNDSTWSLSCDNDESKKNMLSVIILCNYA